MKFIRVCVYVCVLFNVAVCIFSYLRMTLFLLVDFLFFFSYTCSPQKNFVVFLFLSFPPQYIIFCRDIL